MTKRGILAMLTALAALSSCQHGASVVEPMPATLADIAIVGGQVYDGTGAAARSVDIVIADGRIVEIVAAGSAPAARHTTNAAGMVVAPGFIDPHTHAGGDLASDDEQRRANLPYLFQGVTTVVVGNDGNGRSDIAAQAATAGERGVGTNVAFLAGFGPLRKAAIGEANRAPTAAELIAMKQQLRGAMCEGAAGFSAGLYYTPQNFAETGEVTALAKIAADHSGYYDTHMRDESDYSIGLAASVGEALAIGEASGAPVHIAHIKALGPAVHGHSARIIAAIDAARAGGQRVTADQYPWAASGTRISNALVPRDALDGGLAGLRERLGDRDKRAAVAVLIERNLARRGGAEKLLLTGRLGEGVAPTGVTLAQYAQQLGIAPVEAALEILETGDMRLASFNMSEADIHAFAVQDWVATGSDGSTGHPRKYASFPKAYRDFVLEGESMSLAQFIRRSTSLPAGIVGLTDRGRIAPGMRADIVIFDPESFAPVATYESPRELSVGVRTLLVNGELAIDQGRYTGALGGQPLLRPNASAHPACEEKIP